MVKNTGGLSRDFIIHPGETLKEILEDRGMSQRELAIRTGVKEPFISSLVNCQKDISVSFAKKLEYALGIDASFWINLQANYDKELADFEEYDNVTEEELAILKKLNSIIKYLKKTGFVEKEARGSILVIQLRKLLNISSLSDIPDIYQVGAYRLAAAYDVDHYILFAWLRICDLVVKNQLVERELDVEKLKDMIPEIKRLMFENFTEIQSRLKSYLAECGIRFSIVKHFTGAPVQGFIKKNDDETLNLLMTIRQKFADIFWFTFFHEVGHIINGDIEYKLIDYDFAQGEAEDRANGFAASTLIDADEYEDFINKGDFSLSSIKEFCKKQNIPTFILIGRLQKEGFISYSQYAGEKVKYEIEC